MKLTKKKWLVLCISLLLLLAIIIIAFCGNNNESGRERAFNMQVEQGYIHLTDDYDANGVTLNDFFSDKKSQKIMNETIELLRKEKDYYYLDSQDIYIENYKEKLNNISFVPNNDKTLIDHSIAPLKSFQGESRFFNDCGLKNEQDNIIDFGKYNKRIIDIESKEPISIVLGYNYKKYFNKGEIFEGKIYGGLNLMFIVKEFLKDNSKANSKRFNSGISEFSSDSVLDNYIIIPNFVLKTNNKQKTKYVTINACQRCEGLLFIDSEKDCIKKINIIKTIKERTGFQFSTHFALD